MTIFNPEAMKRGPRLAVLPFVATLVAVSVANGIAASEAKLGDLSTRAIPQDDPIIGDLWVLPPEAGRLLALREKVLSQNLDKSSKKEIGNLLNGMIANKEIGSRILALRIIESFHDPTWAEFATRCLKDENSYLRLRALMTIGSISTGQIPSSTEVLDNAVLGDAIPFYIAAGIHYPVEVFEIERAYTKRLLGLNLDHSDSEFIQSASRLLNLSKNAPCDESLTRLYILLVNSKCREAFEMLLDARFESVTLSELQLEFICAAGVLNNLNEVDFAKAIQAREDFTRTGAADSLLPIFREMRDTYSSVGDVGLGEGADLFFGNRL